MRRVFAAFALLACGFAAAVNINGNGASLNLPTSDHWSSEAQTNAMSARLIAAGTPQSGVVSINANGSRLIIEPISATAGKESPKAQFTADPVSGRAPLEVAFTDSSTGGLYEILSWSWDFGDASPGHPAGTSAEQNPTYTFDYPGTYTVTLTITTAAGATSVTQTDLISVTQFMPVAGFAGLVLLAAALGVAILGKAPDFGIAHSRSTPSTTR
jgi:PKD repeat protein